MTGEPRIGEVTGEVTGEVVQGKCLKDWTLNQEFVASNPDLHHDSRSPLLSPLTLVPKWFAQCRAAMKTKDLAVYCRYHH